MYRAAPQQRSRKKRGKLYILILLLLAGLGGVGYYTFTQVNKNTAQATKTIEKFVTYDASVTAEDQLLIEKTMETQQLVVADPVQISTKIANTVDSSNLVIDAFIPVTNWNAVRQKVTSQELAAQSISLPSTLDDSVKTALISHLGLNPLLVKSFTELSEITEDTIALIPAKSLNESVKLLTFDESYYLDSFTAGGLFRTVSVTGEGAGTYSTLDLKQLDTTESVLKVNMTGVTALTRVMMRKLATVKDPLYFSAKIGTFLADADLTHVSNEVSFKAGCEYSNTLFCSPPEFIETLKASGVDIVELTGNHNNDVGSQYNTNSINLYKELGWATIGGGLNTTEAAKPYNADLKGSKVTFLAYNYPDSPNGGAISGADKAGANSFDFDRIKTEIATAKQSSQFVIVNVQYWECYAYPDGYIEFPECDVPIGKQEADFKKLVDLGADMVIGSSAHQPQTYERYKDKPIYYGLGNLYFEQTSWPGTERGIILTHYFKNGVLLQTKLTPTVYDADLQTRIMTDEEAAYLLTRLNSAR